jgi:hypothetical protein
MTQIGNDNYNNNKRKKLRQKKGGGGIVERNLIPSLSFDVVFEPLPNLGGLARSKSS